jgi:hypothetical protein
MDYKSKYLKYKIKYLNLLNSKHQNNLTGGNILNIKPVQLKGIAYLGHVDNSDKNIILMGEAHVDLDELNCSPDSKKIIDWLNTDIIPQFNNPDNSGNMLDIFFEWPYRISYENKEKKKELSEINETLFNLATLIIDTPENIRIHPFDFRNECIQITYKIGLLDKIFRSHIIRNKDTELYIKSNHKILLDIIDEVINLFFMVFFEKQKTTTEESIEKIKKLINVRVTEYINGLDMIFKPYYISYPEHFGILKEDIDEMNEILQSLIKDLNNLIEINKVHTTSPIEYIDGILPNKLFIKNFSKINDKFKEKYLEHNRNIILLKEQFSKKYKKFKDNFKVEEFTEEESKIKIENITAFEENYIINDFTNINNCQDIFINIISEVVDVYTIGRMLKPYVKTSIYYAGLSHTKNMFKKLHEYGFTVKYETNKINRTNWDNIYEFTNYCVDVKEYTI